MLLMAPEVCQHACVSACLHLRSDEHEILPSTLI